ncbi:MAG: DUF1553 domain-containing protein [Bryobacter sp.]|nr:DUF1553 domain-containing protein [Bryobacter sp.]
MSCLPAADFVTDIHPLLASRCFGCHTGAQAQAGLDLTRRDSAARVLNQTLIERVTATGPRRMPPVGPALEPNEVAKLREWIADGAPWVDTAARPASTAPTWQAPLAPRRVTPPPGEGNPIDRFLGAVPPLASDAVFARRVYLDLWGITPPLADLESFVASRVSNKREKLVADLLANRELYTAHWMSWWNDLLRNDIGVVYHGERKAITPWLEKALANNLPYDEMVRELLNPIGNGSPEGFLLGVNWRGDVNASQTPWMQASQNTAQVFLGINLKCASCHDSFINQYKLKQAYGLAAFFSHPPELELVRCDNKTGVQQRAEFLWPELGEVPAGLSASERRYWAAKLFTHPQNGRLARTLVNRYWQKLMGKGIVEPVDDMDARPTNPDLLDWLAVDFADHGYDLKHLLARILSSAAYQRADAQPRRISAEQLVDTLSSIAGVWRPLESRSSALAYLARDWQLKSSPLTRALGRPIRDQVYTTRGEEASTFQALELANGETLASMLHRGARQLVGELPPPPRNLYDSLQYRKGETKITVPVSGRRRVWLLTENVDTYDRERAEVGWKDIVAEGPSGRQVLAAGAVRTPIGSRFIYDLPPGTQTLHASVWVSPASNVSDINPHVRFFVFGEEPDRQHLVNLAGSPPLPAPARLKNPREAVERLFRQVLSRAPSAAEMRLALTLFPSDKLAPEGVEDLLWSLLMHPEFQYIR